MGSNQTRRAWSGTQTGPRPIKTMVLGCIDGAQERHGFSLGLHTTVFQAEIYAINPSAWGHLNPSSYCDVGRFFYRVFKF